MIEVHESDKPAIQFFLKDGKLDQVSWEIDDKQLLNEAAVLHCLNAAVAHIEAARDFRLQHEFAMAMMQSQQGRVQIATAAEQLNGGMKLNRTH